MRGHVEHAMIVDFFRRQLEALAPGARKFALPTGALLGWIAWELSRVTAQSSFGLSLALIVVLAGGASFVLGTLEVRVRANARRMTREALMAEARVCVAWLGFGVASGVHALQAFV
jgi:hypothetical protein